MIFFEIFGIIINGIWQIISIPFDFDGLKISIWQISLFFIVLAYLTKMVFVEKEKK